MGDARERIREEKIEKEKSCVAKQDERVLHVVCGYPGVGR